MIESPPQEKQWLSWVYVVVWTLVIFVTIPLARTIQEFVSQEWNRDLFTYVVLAITALGFVSAAIYVRRHRPVAWRENRIMETYFFNTLQHSDYVWTEENSALAQRHLLPGELNDSWVSKDLITRVSEWIVVCMLIVLILGLMLLHWYLGKNTDRKLPPEP